MTLNQIFNIKTVSNPIMELNVLNFSHRLLGLHGLNQRMLLNTILLRIQKAPDFRKFHDYFAKINIHEKAYWGGIRGILAGLSQDLNYATTKTMEHSLIHIIKLILTYLHIKENPAMITDCLTDIFPKLFSQRYFHGEYGVVISQLPLAELMLAATAITHKRSLDILVSFYDLYSHPQNRDPELISLALKKYFEGMSRYRIHKHEFEEQLKKGRLLSPEIDRSLEKLRAEELTVLNTLRQSLGNPALDSLPEDPHKQSRLLQSRTA